MKISKGTDYALHSLLYLISNGDNQPVTVKRLSDVLNVSVTYLSKILTQLVKAGVIKSASGAKGGYYLVNNWEAIRIYDIITAIDGHRSTIEDSFNHGLECKVQSILNSAEDEMTKSLKSKTLKDLM